MSQIECGRGHLYDPDKYPACPYCNPGQQIIVASASRTAPIRPVTAQNRTAPVSATAPGRTAPVSVTAPQRTAPVSGTPVTAPQKTAPLSGIPVTAAQRTMPPRGYAVNGVPLEPERPAPTAPVSVADGGRTLGLMQEQMGFDPVVGWLVCVEGPSRGKSYTIRGGINSIGRSDRMDITITGDRTISMENHAKVSYSDRNSRFNLLPGDGRNIIYLNGEEVFSPMPLQPYDCIDFGETKLLFLPFCGERFTWKKEEAGNGTP